MGSTRRTVTKSAMSASAAANVSARRFGMVSTVGPTSSVNPPSRTMPARPPGTGDCSSTVTSCPRRLRCAAADRPPSPAPITITCTPEPLRSCGTAGDVVRERGELGLDLAGDVEVVERLDRERGERLDVELELVERARGADCRLDLG